MKVLVINCGSSSIKYKLFVLPQGDLLYSGKVEKIGEKDSPVKNHSQGMAEVFSHLLKSKVIDSLDAIGAVGHRVVHGGKDFKQPHIIDNEVIKRIKVNCKLAPLHNPVNLEGIMATRKLLPSLPQVAVFDTAFHHTLPDYAFFYPLSLDYYHKYDIRKYGFHGTSHQYVSLECARILREPLSRLKIITCHLGNGCSITAVRYGKSVDTSMGFTPLEGLMMGTRCGDIDPALVTYIMDKEKLNPSEMDEILNKKSGLLGVSKISNDVRRINIEKRRGNRLAKLAWNMFVYRIKKYIGAYYFILKGADAICFTGGIGENNPSLVRGIERDIHRTFGKKIKVLVIPTDEEKMIALLTYKLLEKKKRS